MIWKTILLTFLAVGVLAEYQITDEQREQVKNAIKHMCKKNGAEDQADAVETAGKNFVECMKGLFNIDTIKKEIEEAKPNGALDEVFKKYCAKTPELKTCLHTFVTGMTPCLDATIREHINTVSNGTDKLIDFVCHKDGDRIALFIAEKGPECFQEKVTEIRQCAEHSREGISSADDFKKLSEDQMCSKFDELSACIVKALEGCNTPTPGNMAESLFRFLRKSSTCKE
ncbi:27 kDa hemolymph protein-like [Melitaea cinxia]|uniref:27 kDa hemolymph protein-like n=1 Tax=Melitaea cinxia TaxID=113334 RepID=UPI001E27391A|nr:27 kDa hemolymph protein-like [Melitaea cinxia]